MRRLLVLGFLGLSIFLSQGAFGSDLIRIDTNQENNSMVVGYSATYTAVIDENPNPVVSYAWTWRCATGTCSNTKNPVGDANSQSVSIAHSGIGGVIVECTVTFGAILDPDLFPNPPADVTKSVTMTVIGPDRIQLDQGPNELTPFNTYNHWYFRPYAGNKVLGPFVSPLVEESVMHPQSQGGTGIWSAWVNNDRFVWRSEVRAIDDYKIRGWEPATAPNPYPGMSNPLDISYQQVRITIPKCCIDGSLQWLSAIWVLTTKKDATDNNYWIEAN